MASVKSLARNISRVGGRIAKLAWCQKELEFILGILI